MVQLYLFPLCTWDKCFWRESFLVKVFSHISHLWLSFPPSAAIFSWHWCLSWEKESDLEKVVLQYEHFVGWPMLWTCCSCLSLVLFRVNVWSHWLHWYRKRFGILLSSYWLQNTKQFMKTCLGRRQPLTDATTPKLLICFLHPSLFLSSLAHFSRVNSGTNICHSVWSW